MIKRYLETEIKKCLWKNKVIIVLGPRQVGKSTLFHTIADGLDGKKLWLNCDLSADKERLTNPSISSLREIVADNKYVVIDEAQRVENIGLTLKIMHEYFPDTQFLVTGSSALDLHNNLDEPLTGRKITFSMFPISMAELYETNGSYDTINSLHDRMIYGSYPEIVTEESSRRAALMELANSYLFKDLLEYDGVKKSSVLQKLLIALALQIGSEVSYNELSKTVGVDSRTAEKMVDLLEKCFVVFRLNSFSRNIRSELTKSKKIYFYDLGIRNAILNAFAPLDERLDTGALWENFFIAERMKRNAQCGQYVNSYFWRTKTKQEINYVEEYDGRLHIFEMKWNARKANTKFPNSFVETYSPASAEVITPENYLPHIISGLEGK